MSGTESSVYAGAPDLLRTPRRLIDAPSFSLRVPIPLISSSGWRSRQSKAPKLHFATHVDLVSNHTESTLLHSPRRAVTMQYQDSSAAGTMIDAVNYHRERRKMGKTIYTIRIVTRRRGRKALVVPTYGSRGIGWRSRGTGGRNAENHTPLGLRSFCRRACKGAARRERAPKRPGSRPRVTKTHPSSKRPCQSPGT